MLLNDGKALFRSDRTKSEDGVCSASYLCLYPGFCSMHLVPSVVLVLDGFSWRQSSVCGSCV